jgi:hypothetical protein
MKQPSREQVNSMALNVSEAIADYCMVRGLELPDDFENEFHEAMEELIAQGYGDPDYANYN